MNNIIQRSRLLYPITRNFIRRITMTHSLRDEAMESLKSNPYFDKYSTKILEKQKISPEEFNSLLDKCTNKVERIKDPVEIKEKKTFVPGVAKSNRTTTTSNNRLDKIMKLDLIMNKEKKDIIEIWNEYHKHKESTLSATLPVDRFKLIQEKAKKFPVFLLPLPRNQGYEFIMVQLTDQEAHFTPLISYQTHKENAPECLTVIYYSELMDQRDIVLMRGEYDKNIINAMEALCLANQLQLFYGENNEKRDAILHRFTHEPDEFKHMDLIAEIECLTF